MIFSGPPSFGVHKSVRRNRGRSAVVFLYLFLLCLAGPLLAQQGPVVEVLIGTDVPAPSDALEPGELNAPFGVAFEPNGDMWIVEYDGGQLLKYDTPGQLKVVAGSPRLGYVDGAGERARFNKLHNVIRHPDGTLLMSDHLNHAIRAYDPKTGTVSTLAGNGNPGFAGDGGDLASVQFNQPICIELSVSPERILVADIRNYRIRELDLKNDTVKTVAGTGSKGVPKEGALATETPLVDPRAAIATRDGAIYVLERGGNQLRRIDTNGRVTTVVGTGKAGARDGKALEAQLRGPKHMCAAPNGVIYIADDNNDLVRAYDPARGTLTTVDLGPYKLKRPHGVHVRDGWLYICDSYHHRILRVRL